MTKCKKIGITVGLYTTVILAFALTYQCMWLKNPSNFIINEQYNEVTVKPFFVYDDLPDSNLTTKKLITTREVNDSIKPYYDTLSTIIKKLKYVNNDLLITNVRDSIYSDKLMKSYSTNFDKYLAEQLKPYIRTKKYIEDSLSYYRKIQSEISNNSSVYFYNEVIIAKLNVKLSKNEVKINNVKYNAYDKGVKSIMTFYDDSIFLIKKTAQNKIDSLERKKGRFYEDVIKLKEKIRKIADNYYNNRIDRLNFEDFLYFSIISATSTGYGDILPNKSSIRVLVSIEILIEIFLFALLFYFIAQSLKKEK